MKRLITYILIMMSISIYGQEPNEKVLYVVDSIPIFQEITEEEGELSEEYVEYINVVTNKSDFGYYKIYDFDKIIFVFTKEYVKRPDEIRKIPSFPNRFYKKDEKYCLIGTSFPYTGKYIDYYFTGKKKDEGFLKDGIDDGPRYMYYKDGSLKKSLNYTKGIENGESSNYFFNGQIRLKGLYKNGKKEGIWQEWYSNGVLKSEIFYKAGKQKLTDLEKKVNSYYSKGLKSF